MVAEKEEAGLMKKGTAGVTVVLLAVAMAGCTSTGPTSVNVPVPSAPTGKAVEATAPVPAPIAASRVEAAAPAPAPVAASGVLALGKLVANKDAASIPVNAASAPITIDGTLSSAAWKDAAAITDFIMGRSQKAPVETRVLVTYDKENLYLGIVCAEPNTDKLVATATGTDGAVWSDDAVEVYVDANNAKVKEYFGFFVNCKNATYDRTKEANWHGTWSSKTSILPGKAWIAEMAIPFKTLGITPAAGLKLGLMVARDRKAGAEKNGCMYLVPCNDEAKNTTAYPVLELK